MDGQKGISTIMAIRARNRLTAKFITNQTKPGRYSDGGGLWLQVARGGSKSWLFVYRWQGKRPQLGLGGYPAVSLAAARVKAEPLYQAINDTPKRDPRLVLHELAADRSRQSLTFADYKSEFLDSILTEFQNAKHRQQWRNTLETYAAPLNPLSIELIETSDVLRCLKPIWETRRETARRVQGRLERIFDAAIAQGLRRGENPARWKGHLSTLLPRGKQIRNHHQALPWSKVPDLMLELVKVDALSARCLEFTVLTATRSAESREAKWVEFDLDKEVWVIPAERTKMGKAHRVPLSRQALQILQALSDVRSSEFVFPGQSMRKPLSETSVRKVLKRLRPDGVTTHGFRSSFRDWALEATTFPRELAELSLAHQVGDATERAYRRSDGLERRREIMQAWADHTQQNVKPAPLE